MSVNTSDINTCDLPEDLPHLPESQNQQSPHDDDQDTVGGAEDLVEDEDDDEEDEDEEIEPIVIYDRMKNEFLNICSQKDAVSCFAVHTKVCLHASKCHVT